MPTESLPDVLQRLSERGFNDQCRADAKGIHFMRGQAVFAPEKLIVEEVIRLEGTSSPDEQTAVYALVSPDGTMRGSYTVPHGIEVDPLDAAAIARLRVDPETGASDGPSQPLQPQY
jgi:hypothetical protein